MKRRGKIAALGILAACFMLGGCEGLFGNTTQENPAPTENELIGEEVADEAAWLAAFEGWRDNFTVQMNMSNGAEQWNGTAQVKGKEMEYRMVANLDVENVVSWTDYMTEKEGKLYKYTAYEDKTYADENDEKWVAMACGERFYESSCSAYESTRNCEHITWDYLFDYTEFYGINGLFPYVFEMFGECISFEDFKEFTYSAEKSSYVYSYEYEDYFLIDGQRYPESGEVIVQVWIQNGKLAKLYFELWEQDASRDVISDGRNIEKYTYTIGTANPQLPAFVKPSEPSNPDEPQGEASESVADQAAWETAFDGIWDNFAVEMVLTSGDKSEIDTVLVNGKEASVERLWKENDEIISQSVDYYKEQDGVMYRYYEYEDESEWVKVYVAWEEALGDVLIDESFIPYMYLDFQYDEQEKAYVAYTTCSSDIEPCGISKLWIADGKISKIEMVYDMIYGTAYSDGYSCTITMVYTFGGAAPQLPAFDVEATEPVESTPIESSLFPLIEVELVGEKVNSEAEWIAAFEGIWDNFTMDSIKNARESSYSQTILEVNGKEMSENIRSIYSDVITRDSLYYCTEQNGVILAYNGVEWRVSLSEWDNVIAAYKMQFSAEKLAYMYLNFHYDEQEKAYVAYENLLNREYMICKAWIIDGKLARLSMETVEQSVAYAAYGNTRLVYTFGSANPQLPEVSYPDDWVDTETVWRAAFERAKTEATVFGLDGYTVECGDGVVRISSGDYFENIYKEEIYDLITGKYYVREGCYEAQGDSWRELVWGEWTCIDSTVAELQAEVDEYLNEAYRLIVGADSYSSAVYDGYYYGYTINGVSYSAHFENGYLVSVYNDDTGESVGIGYEEITITIPQIETEA